MNFLKLFHNFQATHLQIVIILVHYLVGTFLSIFHLYVLSSAIIFLNDTFENNIRIKRQLQYIKEVIQIFSNYGSEFHH